MEEQSVYQLALKCAEREIPAAEFLNLYKEFFNERFSKNMSENDDSEINGSNMEEVATTLSLNFEELLNTGNSYLLVDYIITVLFVNYNSDLVRVAFPKLITVENNTMLIHFCSKLCAFLSQLSDKLVTDQLCKDLPNVLIPSVLNADYRNSSNELLVSFAKLLQRLLKFITTPITIQKDNAREHSHALVARLSHINKLLHKRLGQMIDSKLIFKDSKVNVFFKDPAHEYIHSPSLTSPQFISSPMSINKTPMSTTSTSKYKDMRLLRYYKNIWLNNKIHNWEPINSDFLSRYAAISPTLFQEGIPSSQSSDTLLTDLVETSFTCFAQFVSNKQYHQVNSNLNLLERKWVIFISKHLPLLILKHSSKNPHVITKALDNIDDKVIKAIRTYYSEKDDIKSRNEDLFDDYSTTSLDIRHDFMKSLIMLNLLTPNVINDYLREDETIDVKTLVTSDDLIINSSQGIKESIKDIPAFVSNEINSLEMEMLNDSSTGLTNGLYQVLTTFESVAPTKQKDIAIGIVNLLKESIGNSNYDKITKLCALLYFNFGHSFTTILSFVDPLTITELLIKFVDDSWGTSSNLKTEMSDDNSYESNSKALSIGWGLLLLIVLSNNYGISLPDVALQSSTISSTNTFSIQFVSKLPEILDTYTIDERNERDPNTQSKSHKLVQSWLSDLFVNGAISDELSQNTQTGQLSTLIPFIIKQVLLAAELGFVSDPSNLLTGFEYFLQPYMLVGLIKVVYWLEQFLSGLKNRTYPEALIQTMFTLLNSILNPSTLNEESRTFHNAILRLNAVPLLKVVRKFRSKNEPNYGVYYSESESSATVGPLIDKLVSVLNMGSIYNVDSRIINTETMYSQTKPIGYGKFLILDENPINKIMTNQMNSFWNLHSSTFYNLDYLYELIDLITPKKFFFDVFQTLKYKSNTYGVPVMRNKISTTETEHVMDYFFYFLVLYDVRSPDDAAKFINFMDTEGHMDTSPVQSEVQLKTENPLKTETSQDDDFDMLFGENDNETSAQEPEEDIQILTVEPKVNENNEMAILKRNSFGRIIHELKVAEEEASL